MAKTCATVTAREEIRTPESFADLEERVRRRAYEIYEKRGREDGHALGDWLQAHRKSYRPASTQSSSQTASDWQPHNKPHVRLGGCCRAGKLCEET